MSENDKDKVKIRDEQDLAIKELEKRKNEIVKQYKESNA